MAEKKPEFAAKDYRRLNDRETAFLKRWFGDTIDYENVKVHSRPYLPAGLQSEHTAMAPNGHIYMNGSTYAEDYTDLKTPVSTLSVFLHEMVHVWQLKNNVLNPIVEAAKETLKHKFDYNAAYRYKLEKGKDLINYGMEQQASIVQDYFMMKNLPLHLPRRLKMDGIKSRDQALELYESVLKNFLKDPSYPRKCKRDITGKAYYTPKKRRPGA
ncbi:MAG: hypothetical protein EA357_06105 [Micavibrio sp.]|nr:MAG: hypothetical protein EA357_06105 [Micavibrio sp.]